MKISSISNTYGYSYSFGAKNSYKGNNRHQGSIPSGSLYTVNNRRYPHPVIPGIYYKSVPKEDETYDSFTGLGDKNHLLSSLRLAMESSKVTRRPLSIAMFDLDNFKSVNELLGYEVGDNFIMAISQDISAVANKNKIQAYRFGGDEFVFLFDSANQKKNNNIVRQVIETVNGGTYLQSQSSEYRKRAENKLAEYSLSSAKVDRIVELKAKKSILDDLHSNLETQEAKQDPYLIRQMNSVNADLRSTYLSLIDERIDEEQDPKIQSRLGQIRDKFLSDTPLDAEEDKRLDEYFHAVFDKTDKVYQIRKWLNDHLYNNGFSLTGAVVEFPPHRLYSRTPMSLIDEVGEVLKRGKNSEKGKPYLNFYSS